MTLIIQKCIVMYGYLIVVILYQFTVSLFSIWIISGIILKVLAYKHVFSVLFLVGERLCQKRPVLREVDFMALHMLLKFLAHPFQLHIDFLPLFYLCPKWALRIDLGIYAEFCALIIRNAFSFCEILVNSDQILSYIPQCPLRGQLY
jgi:hypothetical protein